MLILSGTLPTSDETTVGQVKYDGRSMSIGGREVPVELRSIGTAAMLAAAAKASEALGVEPPTAVVSGDMGDGAGSRKVYRFLTEDAGGLGASVVALHYLLPLRTEFMDFVEMADYWEKRPFLIADAGALLIAKATGLSPKFDLFTPDVGEMAFLADPDAGHPAYVKASLFEADATDVPRLIAEAHASNNAPRFLAVKGPVDYVSDNGRVLHRVAEPDVPVLEAIGGTGDTVTGAVSALVASGVDPVRASLTALKANRMAGALCDPTPATKVFEIVDRLGSAVARALDST